MPENGKTVTMTSNRIRKAIAGGLIGLTSLGAVAIVPSIAEAQTPDGTELSQEEREALREERRAERAERRAEKLAVLTETLDITEDELIAAREAGQSLADVAAAQGVAVDTLVAAIVDSKTDHILEHVAAGDITQEEADEKIAGLEERVTERVNAEPGERGERGRRGFGPRGPRGFGGPGGGDGAGV